MSQNLELSNRFKKKHVLGSADLKPKSRDRKNHVIDLRNSKFKSVTKIERERGKLQGQTKVITDCPSKYIDTGWEEYGEEGEAYFLLTGIKNGKSFVGHHVDCIVTKISDSDGIFVDSWGIKYLYLYDSESADYSSGHDHWGDDGGGDGGDNGGGDDGKNDGDGDDGEDDDEGEGDGGDKDLEENKYTNHNYVQYVDIGDIKPPSMKPSENDHENSCSSSNLEMRSKPKNRPLRKRNLIENEWRHRQAYYSDDNSCTHSESQKNEGTISDTYIVVDTSVIIHHLEEILSIIDSPPNQLLTLYIPWIVSQELDALAKCRRNERVKNIALKAATKIKDVVEADRTRLRKQNEKEDNEAKKIFPIDDDLLIEDKIIQTCMWLINGGKAVKLLSRDVILQLKAGTFHIDLWQQALTDGLSSVYF